MIEVGKEVLAELLERVEKAKGPDRELEFRLAWALGQEPWKGALEAHVGLCMPGSKIAKATPAYTASIDAAVALVEKVLPGWWWKVGTCCVSDDACIAPDFNSPVHGERLHRQFGPIVSGSEIDAGYDVDRRPPGNVPLALLGSLLRALLAQAEKEAG